MINIRATNFQGSSKLRWSIGKPGEGEGVAITLPQDLIYGRMLGSKSLIELLPEKDKAWLRLPASGDILQGYSILNLDNLKAAFSSDVPELLAKDWLSGEIHLDLGSNYLDDLSFQFIITPDTEELKEENFKIKPHLNEMALLSHYERRVLSAHPDLVVHWPVLSGYKCKVGTFKEWVVVIFQHTGDSGHTMLIDIHELSQGVVKTEQIDENNLHIVRRRIGDHFKLEPRDAVLLLKGGRPIGGELELMMKRHETAMGLISQKIFLSHKGADKTLVRDFKETLNLLGFDSWLDQDSVTAGMNIDRAILQGMKESCAVVFFITPSFTDERYLADEIELALKEERKRRGEFKIITLVFEDDGRKGQVPETLHRFAWIDACTHLEALRAILKALPVEVGSVQLK